MNNKISSNIIGIKHMTFAVENIESALKTYQNFLDVDKDVEIMDMPKSRTRVALFEIGNIEYQLCQSQDPDGRFSKWIKERGQGGLHHICYIVENTVWLDQIERMNGVSRLICSELEVRSYHLNW